MWPRRFARAARFPATAILAAAAVLGTLPPAHAGVPAAPAVAAGIITTVAGGVGGPGPARSVGVGPCGLAASRGRLLVSDIYMYAVRQVDTQTDWLTTPAGDGIRGSAGNNGVATSAELDGPCGVTVDHGGNVVVAEDTRIQLAAARSGVFYGRVMRAGHIYTIAADSPRLALCQTYAVVTDSVGNLVFADGCASTIDVIAARSGRYYGRTMVAGRLYVVVGTGIAGYYGDNGPASRAWLWSPGGVALDRAGNIVIADSRNNRVRVAANRSGWFYGRKMTRGDIYTVAGTGVWATRRPDGKASKTAMSPGSVALDGHGNIVLTDGRVERVCVIAERSGVFYGRHMIAGDIYTIAGDGNLQISGDGGPALRAGMSPFTVIVDGAGNVAVADGWREVRVIAANSGTFYGQPMVAGGIYDVAGNGLQIGGEYSGDAAPALSAQLQQEDGMTVDPAGNLIIADWPNNVVRVVAARTGTFFGRAMTAGDIYTVAGNLSVKPAPDGTAATATGMQPFDDAVDAAGNLIVTDSWNSLVRVVASSSGTFYGQAMTAGDIYTIAGGVPGPLGGAGDGGPATKASLYSPAGVVVDSAGNIVAADELNSRIRVIAASTGTFYGVSMTAGDIYTIAGNGTRGFGGDGGPAAKAILFDAAGVALDAAGNVVIADAGNVRIRVVATTTGTFYGRAMTAGDIYTVAANELPLDVVVDIHGNIVVPDGSLVRVIAESSGTFYGVPMIAGHTYTVAGGGALGYSGDGGPAVGASLYNVESVAAASSGDLFLGDGLRIREVSGP